MHSFTYTPDPTNEYDHRSITVQTQTLDLVKVVESFEDYLRGAGFVFNGHLEIIDDEGGGK